MRGVVGLDGEPNQVAANIEANILLGLFFPRKLWRIVEDDTFMFVCWNENGDTVIIEKDIFQREVLAAGTQKIFESDSLKSFICLMNLYGFSKICPSYSSVHAPENDRLMIYHNDNFQGDKPWLIENIKREGNWMTTTAWPGTTATPPKRKKKQVAPTRYSPRSKHREGTKDPEESPKCSKTQWHPVIQVLGSMVHEQCHDGPLPKINGTGDLPTSHLNYPVMYLYNTCYFILMAALSVMAPSMDLSKDKEEEGSSDDSCAL
ncbi:LOW QUALITY PROTEIN: heat shock transcription factor, X-linked member 3-like [Glossophaga mutica]